MGVSSPDELESLVLSLHLNVNSCHVAFYLQKVRVSVHLVTFSVHTWSDKVS